MMKRVSTPDLEIAYEDTGPKNGRPVVLVHGWPDDIHCWDRIVPELMTNGCRVITPYLRGCGPTQFLSSDTLRSGAIAALGEDLIQFIGRLDLEDVLVAGYDWGARAGYAAAALHPEPINVLLAMSAGYATSVPLKSMSYELAQAYWYEWLVAWKLGREALNNDRQRLCRYLWKTWSPNWRFTEEEFSATAASWNNPDWSEISAHAYLQRWGEAEGAPEHREAEERLAENPPINVPTIMLQGAEDRCNLPETSEGKERFFNNGYERKVLQGVGHFLPREAPGEVLSAIHRLRKEP